MELFPTKRSDSNLKTNNIMELIRYGLGGIGIGLVICYVVVIIVEQFKKIRYENIRRIKSQHFL